MQLLDARIIYFSLGENGLSLLFSTELSAAFPQRFFRLCMYPLKEASLHLHRGLSPFWVFFLYPQSISKISVMWEVSPHLLLLYFHSYPLVWLSMIPISSRPVCPGCKCNRSFQAMQLTLTILTSQAQLPPQRASLKRQVILQSREKWYVKHGCTGEGTHKDSSDLPTHTPDLSLGFSWGSEVQVQIQNKK